MSNLRQLLIFSVLSASFIIASCDPFSSLELAWDKTNPSASEAPDLSSKISFISGELNSTSINSTDRSFTVSADTYFMGTITVETLNGFESSANVPLGATNTWDDNASAFWLEQLNIETGTNTYSIDIHETAPSTPGTYYLIIAFNEAESIEEVFSCTDVSVPTAPVWNDGNDVADYDSIQLADATSYGAAETEYLYSDGFSSIWLPSLVIEVIVE